jgi:hypothetical protein
MKEPKWIRLIKLKGSIPTYANPSNETSPVLLHGKFNVQWPDGTMSLTEVKTSKVFARKSDGSEESGLYTYFEDLLYGMSVIYNLHEVELRDDEVVRCMAAPKMRAAG